MKYFKVKKEADNIKVQTNHILVKNELYTAAQLKKYSTETAKYFDEIEVSKNTTYWFFCSRFCTKYPYQS